MEAIAVAPPRPRRRVVLVVLGTILSALLVGIGALMLLDVAASHSFQTTAAYAGVRALVVQDDAGGVSLSSAPAGSRLIVKTNETEGLFKPKLDARPARYGTLTLKGSCPAQPECGVDYVLSVPPGLAVKVKSTVGDVTATDLVSTSSVQLSTGGGDVTATGLSAPSIRLSTGVGNLRATVTRPARSLDASSGAGDVNLTVPDTTYDVHAGSEIGHVSDHAVRNDPTSPRSINAHSSLGDVAIAIAPYPAR
jgi:Putative adhesin